MPRPKKATAVQKPAKPTADDDAMLEACDQPVPLSEPAGKAKPPLPPRPVHPPGPEASHGSRGDDDQGPRTTADPRSLILPDQIELAPVSDVLPTIHNRPPSA